MKSIRIAYSLSVLLAIVVSMNTVPAWAVTFADNTFNLSDYTAVNQQTGGATINTSQTLAGGNPGAALQVITNVSSGTSTFRGSVYLLNKSFTYDPATQGAIQSIEYSEDVFLGFTGISIDSKGGDLLLFQNGNYYLHVDSLPAINNTWGTAKASNLDAASFNLVTNLVSGSTDATQHPNFAKWTLQFGILFFTYTNGSSPSFTSDIRVDNFSVSINSVPVSTCPSDTYHNGKLTINSVEVPDGLGGTLKYKATLSLQPLANPLTFTLDKAELLQ